MFYALDENENKVYIDECEKGKEYRCQSCGELLRVRCGNKRRHHFSHLPGTVCKYDFENAMSEWHIKMQELFPMDSREYRFKDHDTGEIHIADVFIKECNTVIEFQHSRISDEEFNSRTRFHLSNRRRIAWVFDESIKDQNNDDLGRFRKIDNKGDYWMYVGRKFKWMRSPRTCILCGPPIDFESPFNRNYAVLVFTGREENIVHRVVRIGEDTKEATFSVHDIEMKTGMDVNELFKTELEWFSVEPWKTIIENIEKVIAKNNPMRQRIQVIYPVRRKNTYRRKRHF